MNMASNTEWAGAIVVLRDEDCTECGHDGWSHFYDKVGVLAECHAPACHCLRYVS